MDEKLYNLTSLKESVDNDPEEVREMLQLFIDLGLDTLRNMEEVYQDQNYEELGKLAHRMKSSIRLLEIDSLEPVILSIEKNSKEKRNLDQMDSLMKKVSDVLPEVISQIKSEELEMKA